jgi:hypothetical protein
MTKTFNDLFKEYFYIGLVPYPDYKKYYLIQRYWYKVSMRLKAESEKIYNDGKNRFNKFLSYEIKPCLFRHIKCDTAWSGMYHVPVPLIKGIHYD